MSRQRELAQALAGCAGLCTVGAQRMDQLSEQRPQYGGPSPRIELGAEEQADSMVRFWIRDHGPGLAREQQARLFVEFDRLDRTIKPGHGLGLVVVRRVVERMGGQVGVESQPGEGCTFWFTLPAEESPASAADATRRVQFLHQNVPASENGRTHQLLTR